LTGTHAIARAEHDLLGNCEDLGLHGELIRPELDEQDAEIRAAQVQGQELPRF
jgi:hypothetical protein